MGQDLPDFSEFVSRRRFLFSSGALGTAVLAGCTEQSDGESPDGDDGTDSDTDSTDVGDETDHTASETGTETDQRATEETAGAEESNTSHGIRIAGSSTLYPVSTYVAEEFTSDHTDVNVTVDATGTGGGFENHFCVGDADIIAASRRITDEELERCEEHDVEPVEFEIATDALTVVVNAENDWADCLTFEDLSMIWRADGATNWSAVRDDFPDEPIETFGPADTSGSYDWFRANVIDFDDAGRDHTTEYVDTEDDQSIISYLESSVGGIGYFGYAYYEQNSDLVKAVDVRESEDDECVAPSLGAAAEGTYPMARPLYLYANAKAIDREDVATFLEFYLEETGTDAIEEDIGYVPSDGELVEENLATLDEYA